MENIANVAGMGKWAVLLDGNNRPISYDEIVSYGEDGAMVTLERRGLYLKRLIIECDSALSAEETFNEMIMNSEREEAVLEGII